MKVIAHPERRAKRGGPVEIGNVYSNPHGRPHYKIVLGITERCSRGRPWKNVAVYKVLADGSCAGAGTEPEKYLSEHQDLVGKVANMPTLKIKWEE